MTDEAQAPLELEPDIGEIEAFVRAIFRYANGNSFISLRTFLEGRENRGKPPLFIEGYRVDFGLEGLVLRALDRARQAAQEKTSAVFCLLPASFSKQRSAKRSDIVNGLVAVAECDQAPAIALETLSRLLGEPTLTVESGGLWTDPETGETEARLHIYWRLASATIDAEGHRQLAQVNGLIATLVGSDATAAYPGHPLRCPGSVHSKVDPPRLCRIVGRSDNELELAVALEILREAIGDAGAGAGETPASGLNSGGELADIAAAIEIIPNADRPWAEWNNVGMAVWRASSGEGFAVFDRWSRKSGKYDAGETRARWDHFGQYPPEMLGMGSLIFWARQVDRDWKKPSAAARANGPDDGATDGEDGGRADGGSGAAKGGPQSGGAGARRSAPSEERWPEPRPLPDGLLPVANFNIAAFLPESIGPWIADISERMQCPPDYAGITAIVALGTVIGTKIGIRPQAYTDWTEVANQWGCCVGPPGVLKSPAMQEALKPLLRLEARAIEANADEARRYAVEAEAYRIDKDNLIKKSRGRRGKDGEEKGSSGRDAIIAALKMLGDKPEEPKARRYLTNDSTYQALGVLLANNPYGLLVYRDELVSLWATLDQEENAAARGFYLSAWAGKQSYNSDTISRGNTRANLICLSILGSTQPDRLADYVRPANLGGSRNDGLIQRHGLLIWPDQPPGWRDVDEKPDLGARERAWNAFERLDAMRPEEVNAERDPYDEKLPFLRFSDEALERFRDHRVARRLLITSGVLGPALTSHLSKYDKLVPSLALINHLADGGVGPIGLGSVERAIAFADYLETHARRAFAAGDLVEIDAARALIVRLRKGELETGFTTRDVYRRHWAGLSDREAVSAGLNLLVELDWLKVTTQQTSGRPRAVHTVNPRGLK
jgi:putative DNA primase/helicase